VAILDEESLLATWAYIDLNRVAAGIAEVPEASEHTSIKERVDHVEAQGRMEDLKAARKGSVVGSAASAGLEDAHWLCPIEDRRRIDSSREGMIEGFSLGSYLLLADYSGRLFREGKAISSPSLPLASRRLAASCNSPRDALRWISPEDRPTKAGSPVRISHRIEAISLGDS
jgi:hypothetical protein